MVPLVQSEQRVDAADESDGIGSATYESRGDRLSVPVARLRALVERITAWQNDDRAGYDQSIELVCDAKDALEALLASSGEPPQRNPVKLLAAWEVAKGYADGSIHSVQPFAAYDGIHPPFPAGEPPPQGWQTMPAPGTCIRGHVERQPKCPACHDMRIAAFNAAGEPPSPDTQEP